MGGGNSTGIRFLLDFNRLKNARTAAIFACNEGGIGVAPCLLPSKPVRLLRDGPGRLGITGFGVGSRLGESSDIMVRWRWREKKRWGGGAKK